MPKRAHWVEERTVCMKASVKIPPFRDVFFAVLCIILLKQQGCPRHSTGGFNLPVELHIGSSSCAVTIQAHAVQLALQTQLGLALGAVSRLRQHQTHRLNVADNNMCLDQFRTGPPTTPLGLLLRLTGRTKQHNNVCIHPLQSVLSCAYMYVCMFLLSWGVNGLCTCSGTCSMQPHKHRCNANVLYSAHWHWQEKVG